MLRRSLSILMLVSLALALTACPQKSPEDRVLEARNKYTVQLNAFLPQEPEIVPIDGAMEVEEAAEGAAEAVAQASEAVAEEAEAAEADDAGLEEGEEIVEAEPTTRSVFFDLIVLFDGNESLPGVTVEITQADPFEKEKASFRHYLETGPMVKSETKQVSFTIDGLDFEDGDLFSVELRSFVPEGERGEYREFAESGF